MLPVLRQGRDRRRPGDRPEKSGQDAVEEPHLFRDRNRRIRAVHFPVLRPARVGRDRRFDMVVRRDRPRNDREDTQ